MASRGRLRVRRGRSGVAERLAQRHLLLPTTTTPQLPRARPSPIPSLCPILLRLRHHHRQERGQPRRRRAFRPLSRRARRRPRSRAFNLRRGVTSPSPGTTSRPPRMPSTAQKRLRASAPGRRAHQVPSAGQDVAVVLHCPSLQVTHSIPLQIHPRMNALSPLRPLSVRALRTGPARRAAPRVTALRALSPTARARRLRATWVTATWRRAPQSVSSRLFPGAAGPRARPGAAHPARGKGPARSEVPLPVPIIVMTLETRHSRRITVSLRGYDAFISDEY